MTEPSSALNLTRRLIEIPSVSSDKEQLHRIIEFVRNYLDVPGIYIQEFESNGFPSLVATFEDTRHPECLMAGHLDVVSAHDEDFTSTLVHDRLYGRGSGDMKGAAAVMIEVMRHLAMRPDKPSVGLMLTTDEEVGGFNGVHYLLEKEGYRADVGIIPDSNSGMETLILGQKGVLHVKVTAEGQAAHGSRPYLGENAIDKLIQTYAEINAGIPTVASDAEWGTTMNLGRIDGGLNINQVPDEAELHLDIRYTDPSEAQKILSHIKKATKGQYDVLAEGYPVVVSENDAWVKRFADVLERFELEVAFNREEGSSDARFFAEKEIPVIITGLDKGNTHGDKEWVAIDDLSKFQKILSEFLVKSLTPVSALAVA